MSRTALMASLGAGGDGLAGELARVSVAANLSVMLVRSGVSRAELARRLGWTRARVTQVLSGEGNLTIDTVAAVAAALGQTFDLVFRPVDEPRQPQSWEHVASVGTTIRAALVRDVVSMETQSLEWIDAA